MKGPTVSSVIPAFNAERFIGDAIASVLGGTLAPDEVIVVDDGSTDATADVVRSIPDRRILLLQQPNAGFSSAVNRGVRESQGDVLTFCDADDLWAPTRLERQLELLGPLAPPAMVLGATKNFLDGEAPEAPSTQRIGIAPLRGAALMTRSAWNAVGPLDETLRSQGTIEWWTRALAARVTVRRHEEIVLFRRIHGQNLGFTDRGVRDAEMPSVLRAHLARKRASGPG
jgi:glycosyltransferase involved in cell wall biosynthesis